MGVEAAVGGQADGGDEHSVLGFEPGQGRVVADEALLDRDPRPGLCYRHTGTWRVEQPIGCVRGMQVVVEHAVQRPGAVGLAIACAGLLDRVGAQQVMAGEPARRMLGEQVRQGQLPQQHAGLCDGQSGCAGRGRGGDIRPGTHAQQPEHPGGRLAQVPDGP